MIVSDLIEILTQSIKENGDLEVVINDCDTGWYLSIDEDDICSDAENGRLVIDSEYYNDGNYSASKQGN